MRHLIDEGLIPNAGSLQARAKAFEELASPIITKPTKAVDWSVGDTATCAFAGQAGAKDAVVFVAKGGPYQGRVVGAIVPDANQVKAMGLR